jgi:hypothetical protein
MKPRSDHAATVMSLRNIRTLYPTVSGRDSEGDRQAKRPPKRRSLRCSGTRTVDQAARSGVELFRRRRAVAANDHLGFRWHRLHGLSRRLVLSRRKLLNGGGSNVITIPANPIKGFAIVGNRLAPLRKSGSRSSRHKAPFLLDRAYTAFRISGGYHSIFPRRLSQSLSTWDDGLTLSDHGLI